MVADITKTLNIALATQKWLEAWMNTLRSILLQHEDIDDEYQLFLAELLGSTATVYEQVTKAIACYTERLAVIGETHPEKRLHYEEYDP